MSKDEVFPRGMRPVAMGAVSERGRRRAHPHRHAAGMMLVRALQRQEKEDAEKRRRERAERRGRK